MSLPAADRQMSFTDAAFLVGHLFEESTFEWQFRHQVLPVLWELRSEVTKLYTPGRGRPAIEPVLLLAVTVLQFLENKPDRQAARSLRLDMGWKYILGLPLDHPGIHPTTLVKFRHRLVAAGMDRLVFDGVVDALRAAGLVRRQARQRLDSTHILGAVAALNRADLVHETLRLALVALDGLGRLVSMADGERLLARYVQAQVHWGMLSREERTEKFLAAGRDARALLCWARLQDSCVWGHDAVVMLERVFLEQYVLEGPEPEGSKGVPADAVRNPHEPEAQWSTKGSMGRDGWLGYKVQISETVSDDGEPKRKGEPTEQFVVDMLPTAATTGDTEGMAAMQTGQRLRGEALAPELLVDSGYVSGETLAEAAAEGRELTGPPRPARGTKGCFTSEDFDVNVASRTAVCPAGKTSVSCGAVEDKQRGRKLLHFSWGEACLTCPLQAQCTTRQDGHRYLRVGEHHDLLQARRRAMKTEAYRARLRARCGIEGTNSELARMGMRRSRYRGFAKTSLFLYLTGAACNVRRWMTLLRWRLRRDGAFGSSLCEYLRRLGLRIWQVLPGRGLRRPLAA